MANDVSVVSTTSINADDENVQQVNANHSIVQEAFAMDVGSIMTILAHSKGSVKTSGDTEQLKGEGEEVRDSCMAKYTNLWVNI